MPINPQLAILQCTAGYPAAFEELDLRVIDTYRDRFPGAVIGFSSHDNGIAMPVAAYMLGARIVEKHFTLNRAMKGTDHAFSLEPVGLRKMVRDLDRTYKALGNGVKKIYESEKAPIIKMGKSLVVARDLPSGHVLGADDIVMKSPGGGIPPYELDKVLGRVTLRPLHGGRFPHLRGAEQARRRARAFVTLVSGALSASTARSRSSPAPAASSARSGSRRCSMPARASPRSNCRAPRVRRRSARSRSGRRRSAAAVRLRHHQSRVDRSAAAARREPHGRRSVLVNNAGVDQPPDSPGGNRSTIDDLPIEQFRRMIEVNLLGTFQVTQVFGGADGGARQRVDHQHRVALRVGVARSALLRSPARRRAVPQVAGLRRIEGGGRQHDEVLFDASGAGSGVRVNTLSPGGVLAGRTTVQAKYGARVPLGRMAEADDLKGPLVFLASPASSYVTGHELRAGGRPGGFTAW